MSTLAATAPAISIRPGMPGDERGLSQIGQATFLETFAGVLGGADILEHCAVQHAPEVYAAWLADSRNRIWLAEIEPGRAPVGYLVMTPARLPIPDRRDDDLEIKRIYLLHRFQGAGLGRHLLQHAVRHAREAGSPRLLLGVYAGNDSAIAFYVRAGFRPHGERHFRVGANEYADRILALDLFAGEPTS